MTANADFRDRNLACAAQQAAAQARAYTPPNLLQVAESQVDRLNSAKIQAEAERDHFSTAFLREQRDHEFTERRLSTLKADLLKVQLQLEQMHHRALNAERALLEYEISQIETPEAS